jgi:hypothetical protein
MGITALGQLVVKNPIPINILIGLSISKAMKSAMDAVTSARGSIL